MAQLTTNAVELTAYCVCRKCCGPNAKGITASGLRAKVGRDMAGPRKYPLGTKVWIEGIGERVINDRTSRRIDGWDLLVNNHSMAKQFGRQQRKIWLANIR